MFFDLVSAVEILTVLLVTVLMVWYLHYQYCFTYWKRKGVPYAQPRFPLGNITPAVLGRESLNVELQKLFRNFKVKGERHAGLYFIKGPIYFPIDPEIIKDIMTTSFEHFVDRGTYHNEEFPLSEHLFSVTGSKWRNLRAKLSPAFTSGKLKTMYHNIFMKNTENLIKNLEAEAELNKEINSKRWMERFTADIIASSAFGFELNSLKNPDSRFSRMVMKILNPSMWTTLKTVWEEGLQRPGNIAKSMHRDKEIEDYFTSIVRETIKYREENDVVRNDFFSLLMDVKKKVGLSFNEIKAQCFIFFLGGFETSSSTISFALHELAYKQHMQNRLREEIYENLGHDYTKFTYDALLKLPYLDKVVKETLRLYPAAGFFNRMCVKDYKVPGTDVIIEEGTPVLISTLGLQRDPDYFPDPLRFDPGRFDPENSHTPFTFMPFGEGPRNCIAMRYGQLLTKLGIAALVSQFKFSPSEKSPECVEFDKLSTTLFTSKKEGMFVHIAKV